MSPSINTHIYDQASEWFMEFRTSDPDHHTRKRFLAWLRESPQHLHAYLELAAIWNEGANLDGARRFDDETLLAEAMQEANIVPIGSHAPNDRDIARSDRTDRRRLRSSSVKWASAASILIAAVGFGAWLYSQEGVYETGIGERRSIMLPDSTHVELNADSRIRVRYTAHNRDVELLAGQAYFHVAKDKSRPLVVTSGNTRVRAVGTEFDVYRRHSGTTVTVVEGKVSVTMSPEPSARSPKSETRTGIAVQSSALLLAAGQQLTVPMRGTVESLQPAEPPTTEQTRLVAATAWTRGRLIFEATRLQEVADEFNRYNVRPMVINDPQLKELKITGIFASTDPASLIRFLTSRPGVTVEENADEVIVKRAE